MIYNLIFVFPVFFRCSLNWYYALIFSVPSINNIYASLCNEAKIAIISDIQKNEHTGLLETSVSHPPLGVWASTGKSPCAI